MEIKDLKEKGCVYFFKHIGLEPIKIGYSASPSPEKRFSQFKTYAPFGAELLGFIICDDAKELETKLHLKYNHKRLDGEWFLISIEEVESEIKNNTAKEIVKFKNELQIKLAKEINNLTQVNEKIIKEETGFVRFKKFYNKIDKEKINISIASKQLKVSRVTIYNWINKLNN